MEVLEATMAEQLQLPALRAAAKRFGLRGYSRMTKAELVEALEYTAWSVAAEAVHFYFNEHHPKNGQPAGTCAVCFRTRDAHGGGQPGRWGWPRDWKWQLGEPYPETS